MLKLSYLLLTSVLFISNISLGARLKNNAPSSSEATKLVKKAGKDHYPEKMRIKRYGSLKVSSGDKETYFHVYQGIRKDGAYHIIIFDNDKKYLGFYISELEIADIEDKAILFDDGTGSAEGGVSYEKLTFEIDGPPKMAVINDVQMPFITVPSDESTEDQVDEATKKIELVKKLEKTPTGPKYREWKLTLQGKERSVRAQFVRIEQEKKMLIIKSEANGNEASVPLSSLSESDREYVKGILQKH